MLYLFSCNLLLSLYNYVSTYSSALFDVRVVLYSVVWMCHIFFLTILLMVKK